MKWEATTLIVAFVVGMAISISQIDKPRPVLKASTAAVMFVVVLGEIWLLVRLGRTS